MQGKSCVSTSGGNAWDWDGPCSLPERDRRRGTMTPTHAVCLESAALGQTARFPVPVRPPQTADGHQLLAGFKRVTRERGRRCIHARIPRGSLRAIVPLNGACMAPIRSRPPMNKIPHHQHPRFWTRVWMGIASQAFIQDLRQPTPDTGRRTFFITTETSPVHFRTARPYRPGQLHTGCVIAKR
jgi:hypothetical protein